MEGASACPKFLYKPIDMSNGLTCEVVFILLWYRTGIIDQLFVELGIEDYLLRNLLELAGTDVSYMPKAYLGSY
jgi:hypothetical protein